MVGDGAVGNKRHGAIPLGNGGFRPFAVICHCSDSMAAS